ncbi:polysaccharide deacetylase family protein [Ruminiclostridium josui]|uniref:polysaccharide deacetylase family protein n=1 Tax=Ruminiclostridium josui TaxID=1499 RepID=UPI000687F4B6|nr:polysaccharide deacetylase family protein [Ruminiclostridium josui]
MKIRLLLVKAKKIPKKVAIAIMFILICTIFVTIGYTTDSIGVFNSAKHLPIYSVETDKNAVSITFDCAWGADDISQILDTLKSENVKATFFMVGQWAEKFPDAVKLIANDGHDIANHGYSHLRMSTISKEKCKSEIELCNKKLEEISGEKINLFRPPYGDYNNTVIDTCNEMGCYPIQWNVDSLDWRKEMSRQDILDRILKRTKPGAILLFHNDTKYTAQLLPEIIKGLKSQGLEFLPVSQLIMKENYYIDEQGRQHKNK